MNKNIAIIPARGGSKGLPKKNIRTLLGKPLIQWSIEHALAARCIDQVYVSTDAPDIARISEASGATVIWRPEAISGDTASSESAIAHTLDNLTEPPETIFFLQCTSPIRQADDLDKAYAIFMQKQADSLLTVVRSHAFLWQEMSDGYARAVNYDAANRPRRQDMVPQYKENGSFYLFSHDSFRKHNNRLGGKIALFEMDEVSAIEIDSATDFEIIEALLRQRHPNICEKS